MPMYRRFPAPLAALVFCAGMLRAETSVLLPAADAAGRLIPDVVQLDNPSSSDVALRAPEPATIRVLWKGLPFRDGLSPREPHFPVVRWNFRARNRVPTWVFGREVAASTSADAPNFYPASGLYLIRGEALIDGRPHYSITIPFRVLPGAAAESRGALRRLLFERRIEEWRHTRPFP